MELILYTLRTVAYAMVEPTHIIILLVLAVTLYIKNKKISFMQKVTIGESLDSPLELTLSQIVIGITGGVIASLILSHLGIVFNEISGIEVMFSISLLLLFFKKRFICFSYSGAVLGLISIISGLINKYTNSTVAMEVDILALMTLVGVLHIIEGILVMIDGGRGAIPVFTNKDDKIAGGFSFNRYWIMPIAVFIALNSQINDVATAAIATPTWWPLINKTAVTKILTAAIIVATPFYCVTGYNAVSFTKDKRKKPIHSGIGILIYGLSLVAIAQIAQFGILAQLVVIIYAPLAHEFMIKTQNKLEQKGEYLYVTDNDGVAVLEVAPNSPAFEIGIRRGDKIVAINKQKVLSEVEVFNVAKQCAIEFPIKIKKISGEIVDLVIKPRNKRLGILLVPKMVESKDKVSLDTNKFRKMLEEMKRKR